MLLCRVRMLVGSDDDDDDDDDGVKVDSRREGLGWTACWRAGEPGGRSQCYWPGRHSVEMAFTSIIWSNVSTRVWPASCAKPGNASPQQYLSAEIPRGQSALSLSLYVAVSTSLSLSLSLLLSVTVTVTVIVTVDVCRCRNRCHCCCLSLMLSLLLSQILSVHSFFYSI